MRKLNLWCAAVFILSAGLIYYPHGIVALILLGLINILQGFEPQLSEAKERNYSGRHTMLLVVLIVAIVLMALAFLGYVERHVGFDIGMRVMGGIYLLLTVYIYFQGVKATKLR
uniref:hypothetical protein n=1 Tax=Thaumasiovibrio occultus TaxID=1891184 RepID=UPI000B35203B|nr:hypothetical protein [Thaumasiovibrio occultus]